MMQGDLQLTTMWVNRMPFDHSDKMQGAKKTDGYITARCGASIDLVPVLFMTLREHLVGRIRRNMLREGEPSIDCIQGIGQIVLCCT